MPTTAECVDAVRDAEARVEAARLVREGYRRRSPELLIDEGQAAAEVGGLLDLDEELLGRPYIPLEVDDVLWGRVTLLSEFVNPEERSVKEPRC
ncbi:hypothetical protein [Microbacterium sp. LWH13-1.2]|uniref:hypothetical protein n=1 Tax=Microbacterium sp. LWH13-1.2 TaxID=3135260 RepID=UPI003139E6A2